MIENMEDTIFAEPCYCGGMPITNSYQFEEENKYLISCKQCKIHYPLYESEIEAVKRWNLKQQIVKNEKKTQEHAYNHLREELADGDMLFDGFDDALIGTVSVFTKEGNTERALYDLDKCREILMQRDGMTFDGADEYLFSVLMLDPTPKGGGLLGDLGDSSCFVKIFRKYRLYITKVLLISISTI